jgi:hypothetical protein
MPSVGSTHRIQLRYQQLTMTASFIPPIQSPEPPRSRPPPLSLTDPNSTTSSLAPPRTPNQPIVTSIDGSHGPPVTPNPFPAMNEGEERYAGIEGVLVWEGEVQLPSEETGWTEGVEQKERIVIKREEGWQVVWRGELPISKSVLSSRC